MAQVKNGDSVKVHYTGKLEDGSIFDSSEGRSPLAFKVGAGQMIKGFDRGVVGMVLNEKKSISVSPEDGYGHINNDLVIEISRDTVPSDLKLEKGLKLQMTQQNGRPVVVTVTDLNEEKVTLDANHHLAGKTLIFDVELVDLKS